MPPPPTRRSLLRAVLLGGAAVVLTGCEPDPVNRRQPAPTTRVVPDDPATWPVDSELLLSVRERLHRTVGTARSVEEPSTALREAISGWETQLERLEDLISSGDVPLPPLAPHDRAAATSAPGASPTTAAGDDGSATTGAGDAAEGTAAPEGPDQRDLARTLRAELPDLVTEISSASTTNLAMLVSIAGHQAASAIRLGAGIGWDPLVGPKGAAAVPLLAVTRPAIFGLEVVAARSRGEERTGYEKVLDEVRALTRQLTSLAGSAAPVAPLGYDLPEPLDEEDERQALARELVRDIAPAALSAASRARGRSAELTDLVRIVAESVAWGRAFDAPPEPFPGMTLP